MPEKGGLLLGKKYTRAVGNAVDIEKINVDCAVGACGEVWIPEKLS